MKQVCKLVSSSRCIGLPVLSSPAVLVSVNEISLGSLSGVIERSRMFLTSITKEMCTYISDTGDSSIADSYCFPHFSSQNCFELFNANCKGQKIKACKTDGDGRVVEGKHQSYKISAASQEDRDLWIEAIR